jgi:hypothetical protein
MQPVGGNPGWWLSSKDVGRRRAGRGSGPGPFSPPPRSFLSPCRSGLFLFFVQDTWPPLLQVDVAGRDGLHGFAVSHLGFVTVMETVSTIGVVVGVPARVRGDRRVVAVAAVAPVGAVRGRHGRGEPAAQ